MKHKIVMMTILVMALFMTLGAQAETFTIKVINTPTININGKELKVGDSFDQNATINWSSDKQAVKVLSNENEVLVLTPKRFKQCGAKNFSDFIAQTKTTSARAFGFPATLEDHEINFTRDFILLDTIGVTVGWVVDNQSYFTAQQQLKSRTISKVIPYQDNEVLMSRDFLSAFEAEEDTITLTIKYIEKGYNDSTIITDKMQIWVAPETLKQGE